MGLFSRHESRAPDLRDRDYVLAGCPLVAQDDRLVLVDVTTRLSVRDPGDDDRRFTLGYDPTEEPAMHAVCVVALRLMAERVPSEELLTGRSHVIEALEHAFAMAPIGTGVDARVLSVEVRPHDPSRVSLRHEFRVVG